MIMQENRSFDSYFGTYPGANGIPADVCVPDPLHGGCVAPFHDAAQKNSGGPHGTEAATADIDGGLMDGFVGQQEAAQSCGSTDPECATCQEEGTKCDDVMGYHDAREIPNYWTYAKDFVLQDDMFASSASWSLPEHLYMVSGWSAICPKGATEPLSCAGSLSPVKPAAGWSSPLEPGRASYAWTDLTYLLHKDGVSWRYYIHEGTEPDCEDDESVTCSKGQAERQDTGDLEPAAGLHRRQGRQPAEQHPAAAELLRSAAHANPHAGFRTSRGRSRAMKSANTRRAPSNAGRHT